MVVGCDEGGREYVTLQHCVGNAAKRHMTRPKVPPSFGAHAGGAGGFWGEGEEEEEDEAEGDGEEEVEYGDVADYADAAECGESEEYADMAGYDEGGGEGDDGSGEEDNEEWRQMTFPREASAALLQLINAYPAWTRRSDLLPVHAEAAEAAAAGGQYGGVVRALIEGLYVSGVLQSRRPPEPKGAPRTAAGKKGGKADKRRAASGEAGASKKRDEKARRGEKRGPSRSSEGPKARKRARKKARE